LLFLGKQKQLIALGLINKHNVAAMYGSKAGKNSVNNDIKETKVIASTTMI